MAGKEALHSLLLQIHAQRHRPLRAGKLQVKATDDGMHPLITAHLPGPLHYVFDPGVAAADEDDESTWALVGQSRVIRYGILLYSPTSQYVTKQ